MSSSAMLGPAQGLGGLPDELVLMIMKCLVPPIELSEDTHSLAKLRGPESRAYVYGLINLGATDRRFHIMVNEVFLRDFTFGLRHDLWHDGNLKSPMQTFGVHQKTLKNELADTVPRDLVSQVQRIALDHHGVVLLSKSWPFGIMNLGECFGNVRHLTTHLIIPTSCAWGYDTPQYRAELSRQPEVQLYIPEENKIREFAHELIGALPALETIELVRRSEAFIELQQRGGMYQRVPSMSHPNTPSNPLARELSRTRAHLDKLAEHDADVFKALQSRLDVVKIARASATRTP